MIRNTASPRRQLQRLSRLARRWRHWVLRCSRSRDRVAGRQEREYHTRHFELLASINELVQSRSLSGGDREVAERYLQLIRPWSNGQALRQAPPHIVDDLLAQESLLLAQLCGHQPLETILHSRKLWLVLGCAGLTAVIVLLIVNQDELNLGETRNLFAAASRRTRIVFHAIKRSSWSERIVATVLFVWIGGTLVLSGVKKG